MFPPRPPCSNDYWFAERLYYTPAKLWFILMSWNLTYVILRGVFHVGLNLAWIHAGVTIWYFWNTIGKPFIWKRKYAFIRMATRLQTIPCAEVKETMFSAFVEHVVYDKGYSLEDIVAAVERTGIKVDEIKRKQMIEHLNGVVQIAHNQLKLDRYETKNLWIKTP